MTDFYPLVLRALSKLGRKSEEDRHALYQRARETLAARLRKLDPPLSEQRIMAERLAFEEAVRRAEADWARGRSEHDLLSKLADAVEHGRSAGEPPQRTGQAWSHLSGMLRRARSGVGFEYTQDGSFVSASSDPQADRATAADPLVRSIRSELGYKAREVAERLARTSERARWRGLIDAVRLFAARIADSETEIAAEIGTLWILHAALGLYVDAQAIAAPDEIFVPLEADTLRALRDLVSVAGPWIGMFPTGCVLEEETRASGSPASEVVDAATTFLRNAAQAALLVEEDATLVRAVLDAGTAAGLAERPGNWAVHTASNLGISLLLALAGIVGTYESADAIAPSELARRIERLLLEQESRLLLVSSHQPEEVRNALQTAIDAIRASAEDDV
jgi:hypothetical protein